MIGTAESSGTVEKTGKDDNLALPEGLLKCMSCFMKVPIKEPVEETSTKE